MSDEWFVRVHDKEYGPVDLDTLREWRADGRVIPQNELRRADSSEWVLAAGLPELYPAPPPLPLVQSRYLRPRGFGELLADTFRIYGRGFPQFFALALLLAIPSLCLQVCMSFIDTAGAPPLN